MKCNTFDWDWTQCIFCNENLLNEMFFYINFRIGKKSTRLVNAAAVKLSEELFNMIDRPDYARVTRVREGTETQVKSF